MKLLVTGGAGFIGSNFVYHIWRRYPQYHITVLDALTYAGNLENIPKEVKGSSRFVFWQGDVRDYALVQSLVREVDAVVHFAAETHVARSIFDDRKFYETDVLGTHAVASAVMRTPHLQLFVHISTSEVYGSARRVPMDEEHPLEPTTPYASAKCGADRLVQSYHITYDIPSVILRPFNNYGPRQHLEKVIPRFIVRALMKEPLIVHGHGRHTRDWIHVSDTCRAIDSILHAPPSEVIGKVFNIGPGKEASIIQIAEKVLELTHSPSDIVFVEDRPGQVTRHVASYERIKRAVGWRPQIDLEEGLKATVEWYKKNPQWWQSLLWMLKIPFKGRGKEALWL